jgi:hypothetical protein
MDQSSLYKFTELLSLKKIETEFWERLENNLREKNTYEKINMKPLIKAQKSLNNIMLKLISKTADDLAGANMPPPPQLISSDAVDEVEGFVNVDICSQQIPE